MQKLFRLLVYFQVSAWTVERRAPLGRHVLYDGRGLWGAVAEHHVLFPFSANSVESINIGTTRVVRANPLDQITDTHVSIQEKKPRYPRISWIEEIRFPATHVPSRQLPSIIDAGQC